MAASIGGLVVQCVFAVGPVKNEGFGRQKVGRRRQEANFEHWNDESMVLATRRKKVMYNC